MSVRDIMAALAAQPLTYTDEISLHGEISSVLTGAGIEHRREVPMGPRNRIDLLVGRIGIEVKVAGQVASVVRQLTRYAERDEIDSLILVTTIAKHNGVPRTIAGKTVHVYSLIGQGL